MAAIGLTVAATFFFSATGWPRRPQPAFTPPSATEAKRVESVVVFSGGEDRGEGNAYLNPSSALVASPDGEVTVTGWWITPSGEEENVLYESGPDGAAGLDEALTRIRARGGGVYVVWFRLTDGEGFSYRQHRNFRVG